MMDAYWELRARRTTTSTEPALGEFMRLEYPGETTAWLLVAAEVPTHPAGPHPRSGPHPFWGRILTRLRIGGGLRAPETTAPGEATF